jgi:neutral trehalase
MLESSLVAAQLAASQEGLSSMKSVSSSTISFEANEIYAVTKTFLDKLRNIDTNTAMGNKTNRLITARPLRRKRAVSRKLEVRFHFWFEVPHNENRDISIRFTSLAQITLRLSGLVLLSLIHIAQFIIMRDCML